MDIDTGTSEQGRLLLSSLSPEFECQQKLLPGSSQGVSEIELTFKSPRPSTPQRCKLTWIEPMKEIHHKWVPGPNRSQHLDFKDTKAQSFLSRIHESSPVVCLYKLNGNNTLLFALSDAMHESRLKFQVTEEGRLECSVILFTEKWEHVREVTVTLRIDRRSLPIQDCLRDCAQWWDRLIPGSIGDLPQGAQLPRYNMRGKLSESTLAEVEQKSSLAKEMGMSSFSFGAGWPEISHIQPDKAALEKLKGYAQSLKKKGIKSLVRINPTRCRQSSIESFRDKLIGPRDAFGELIDPKETALDFRFPDIRKLAIEACQNILKTCELDGVILNFSEGHDPMSAQTHGDPAQDFHSTAEAFSVFLSELRISLRNTHPDALIEIHQPAIGPYILKAANMLRAEHCGNSFADNRKRILDIRMLCGRVTPHASPVFWNPSESVESAAMQLTHTLFGVPQVAQDLASLPLDHREMLVYFLSFWSAHRDVILEGKLNATEPQNGFPLVSSVNEEKLLIAVYANTVIQLNHDLRDHIVVVNGTYRDHVVLEHDDKLGPHHMEIRSCKGEVLLQRNEDFQAGLNRIDVPINGTITLKNIDS